MDKSDLSLILLTIKTNGSESEIGHFILPKRSSLHNSTLLSMYKNQNNRNILQSN